MVIFHSYVKLPEGMVSDTPEMLYDSATRRLFRTYHIFPAPEERRTHLLRHGFGRWFGSHLGNTARVLLVQVTKLFFRSVGERTTSNLYVERYDHWHKFFFFLMHVYHWLSLYISILFNELTLTTSTKVQRSSTLWPLPTGPWACPGLAFEFDCVCDGVDFTLRAWKHLEPLKGGLTGGRDWLVGGSLPSSNDFARDMGWYGI